MVAKYFVLLFTLFTISALGNPPIEGYVEGRSNYKGNRPVYIDGTGGPTLYGVDFEFRIPVVESNYVPIRLLLGADSFGGQSGFTRVAGRAGLFTVLPWFRNLELGIAHRSEHNMDYANKNVPQRFFSDDWVFIRYNFGVQHR